MTKFDRTSFQVGGKITIPDSMVCTGPGEINAVLPGSISVLYDLGATKKVAMYSYAFLNAHYGDRNVPFDTP